MLPPCCRVMRPDQTAARSGGHGRQCSAAPYGSIASSPSSPHAMSRTLQRRRGITSPRWRRGFQTAAAAHVDAWRRRWENAEVRIAGDEEAQRALRFAIYHLIAAANPADEHASIGARGLTGEAYRGHVFWDTEIYMLPFYSFTDPPTARALLKYRYHTLDAARRKAKEHGYEGALYAWESADTGDETTPTRAVMPDGRVIIIRTGEREHHISADIAYAVWQYWRRPATMPSCWKQVPRSSWRRHASGRVRAQVELDGRAHIRQVIGPDEYHELIDDNAYTNAMAAFNLERAADVVDIFSREQVRRLATGVGAAWSCRSRNPRAGA